MLSKQSVLGWLWVFDEVNIPIGIFTEEFRNQALALTNSHSQRGSVWKKTEASVYSWRGFLRAESKRLWTSVLLFSNACIWLMAFLSTLGMADVAVSSAVGGSAPAN